MIGRTNASSGGGISGNRAVLVARIPSGSTVTATKGGVTLTPMMWVSETYPDQDIALFVFAPAQFDSINPWTITATDGTDTASDTVLITSNKEYEVELSYNYLIWDSTKTLDDIAIGSNGGTITKSISDGNLVVGLPGSPNATAWNIITSAAVVDVTNYSRMVIEFATSGNATAQSSQLQLSKYGTTNSTSYVTKADDTTSTIGNHAITLDISSASGSYYPRLVAYSAINRPVTVTVTRWLLTNQ